MKVLLKLVERSLELYGYHVTYWKVLLEVQYQRKSYAHKICLIRLRNERERKKETKV